MRGPKHDPKPEDWVWISANRIDQTDLFRKVEVLGRVLEKIPDEAEWETPVYAVEYFFGGERRINWFSWSELWECTPDQEEICQWLQGVLES